METQPRKNSDSKRWIQTDSAPEPADSALEPAILRISKPVFVLDLDDKTGVSNNGFIVIGKNTHEESNSYKLKAYAPPLHPKDLGDPHFKEIHNVKYAYVAGAMANGIASVKMVQEAGKYGLLGPSGRKQCH